MENDKGLLNLGFSGNLFTWNNQRGGKHNIQERPDRSFKNDEWRLMFQQASISHLASLDFDQRPILLKLYHVRMSRSKPFRFEGMWTRDPTVVMLYLKLGLKAALFRALTRL